MMGGGGKHAGERRLGEGGEGKRERNHQLGSGKHHGEQVRGKCVKHRGPDGGSRHGKPERTLPTGSIAAGTAQAT